MTRAKARKASDKNKFHKVTISLPLDLWPHAERRKEDMQHAGSLSSYIRALIIADVSKEIAK